MQCIDDGADIPDQIKFARDVRPILSDRCFRCHGPDDDTREAGLALHLPEGLFAALDSTGSHWVVAPGKLHQSELYHRITSTDVGYQMPPPSSHLELSTREIKILEKWIKQGAPWQDHWAFEPYERPGLPKVSLAAWRDNPIDAFILDELRRQKLKPASEDRPTLWLRRVSFDLTGLPPSEEMLRWFETNHTEADYEKVVDELLSSTAYGERMATIWLDLARYADSHGYQDDRPRTMWPWRDWVVRAFNDNMAFDQFVTWQLAGDLLPESSYDQLLATGFNRNHAITQEGGVINEEYLTEYAADRVETFGAAFLGITMQCARCHDPKYDPFSMEDYYGLMAFFNNVDGERGQINYFDEAPVPHMPLDDAAHTAYLVEVKTRIGQLETTLTQQLDSWLPDPTTHERVILPSARHHYALDEAEEPYRDQVTDLAQAYANMLLPAEIDMPSSQPGRQGLALCFDGDNFVTLGEIGDYDQHHRFSVSIWFRHSGQHQRGAAIFARRNEELKRQGYDAYIDKDNKIGFRLLHDWTSAFLEVKTVRAVAAHQWKQLTVTYDGSGQAAGVRIYLDGRRQSTIVSRDSLGLGSIANGNDFIIGHWNHRATLQQQLYGLAGGCIDEIRIYDLELTEAEVAALYEPATSVPAATLAQHRIQRHDPAFVARRQQLDSLRAIDRRMPHVMIMKERDTMIETFVLNRGLYDQPTTKVHRQTPRRLPVLHDFEPTRLGLANWLFDKSNPLTARVAVNRLWQQCFGHGIVTTPEDFGSQSALPSHPDLLNWLAHEFVDSGWDLRHMLRLMVLSKTYRQSKQPQGRALEVDPDNRYLARGPYKALTAEMVRDQALANSGLLYDKVGGWWVKPYQPQGIWKELANQIGENKYRVSEGRDVHRRSLYTYWKRTIPPPAMMTFDTPDRTVCSVKRQSTNTPLQALTLLNATQYVEAARYWAAQALHRSADIEESIEEVFWKYTCRRPYTREIATLKRLYHDLLAQYQQDQAGAQALTSIGQVGSAIDVDTAKHAALTIVVSTIMNLDEARY